MIGTLAGAPLTLLSNLAQTRHEGSSRLSPFGQDGC